MSRTLLAGAVSLLLLLPCLPAAAEPHRLHVAPDGEDTHPSTEARPLIITGWAEVEPGRWQAPAPEGGGPAGAFRQRLLEEGS